MTNQFSIIGQHRENPNQFLLLGDDGQHYATDISMSEPTPVESDDDYLIDEYVADFDDLSFHEPDEKLDWPPGFSE
jgi:hypothetical protein